MSFIDDYQQEIKRQKNSGRCLHFHDGVRCNQIISAHSIQKQGQLSLIAEKGHVYRLNADFSTLKQSNGIPILKKIGIKKVSTFVGFCKHHDNLLFEPIDNKPLEPNEQQIALYSYRSLCREFFVKENVVNALSRLKDHPEIDEDQKYFLSLSFRRNKCGFDRLQYHKKIYDDCFLNKRFEEFKFIYFTSTSLFPLQLSGLLFPDCNFLGQQIQDLRDQKQPLDLITFFTAPTPDGWAFCFAWHESSDRSCLPFIQSLGLLVADGDKLEDAIFRFSLSCCENHAIRISWWDSLSEKAKRTIIEQLMIWSSPFIPVPRDYLVYGCENIVDWNFDYLSRNFDDLQMNLSAEET